MWIDVIQLISLVGGFGALCMFIGAGIGYYQRTVEVQKEARREQQQV